MNVYKSFIDHDIVSEHKDYSKLFDGLDGVLTYREDMFDISEYCLTRTAECRFDETITMNSETKEARDHLYDLTLKYNNIYTSTIFDVSGISNGIYDVEFKINNLGIDSILWKMYTDKIRKALNIFVNGVKKIYREAGGDPCYVDYIEIDRFTFMVIDGKAVLVNLVIKD